MVQNIAFPAPDNSADKTQVGQQFKPGDIVFTKAMGRRIEKVDYAIVGLQGVTSLFRKIASKLMGGSDASVKGASQIVHAAVVLRVEGDKVLLADAMPTGGYNLRTIDLWTHNDAQLKDEYDYMYEVFHCPDEQLAARAVAIAERVTLKAPYLLDSAEKDQVKRDKLAKDQRNTFSFGKAARAIVSKPSSKLIKSKHAQRKAIQAVFAEAIGAQEVANSKGRGERFFCSHFVSHVYRQAAMATKWAEGADEDFQRVMQPLQKEFSENEARIAELKRDLQATSKGPRGITGKLKQAGNMAKAKPGQLGQMVAHIRPGKAGQGKRRRQSVSPARDRQQLEKASHAQKKLELARLRSRQKDILKAGVEWAKDIADRKYTDTAAKGHDLFMVNSEQMGPQDLRQYVEQKKFEHAFDLYAPGALPGKEP